jgi:hypothetical protein
VELQWMGQPGLASSGHSGGNVQFDSGWRTILGAVMSCSHGSGRLKVQEIAQNVPEA